MNSRITPNCKRLSSYIEYYWIVRDVDSLFSRTKEVTSYAGITPELVLTLHGKLEIRSKGECREMHKSFLSTIMQNMLSLKFEKLHSFIVVRFKTSALASLLPFINLNAFEMAKIPIIKAEDIFGPNITALSQRVRGLSNQEIAGELDQFFTDRLNEDQSGFILDAAPILDQCFSVESLKKQFKYSQSTLERKFKYETGLTPKRYMILKRFRATIDEVLATENTDWMHYVVKYQYYDQSHFIKEIKRFSGLSPRLLLGDNCLPKYRPINVDH